MRMALTACCEALGVVVCAAKEAAEKAAQKAEAARAAGEGAAGDGAVPAQPPPRRVLLRHMAAALNKVRAARVSPQLAPCLALHSHTPAACRAGRRSVVAGWPAARHS